MTEIDEAHHLLMTLSLNGWGLVGRWPDGRLRWQNRAPIAVTLDDVEVYGAQHALAGRLRPALDAIREAMKEHGPAYYSVLGISRSS